MKTHALIVPWPISQGLHTWCGYRFDAPEVADEHVASAPEAVTCERCISAMSDALANLTEWVPKLGPRVPDGIPHVRDAGAPCEYFVPGTPAGNGACLGDGHYLCQECEEMTPEVDDEDAG